MAEAWLLDSQGLACLPHPMALSTGCSSLDWAPSVPRDFLSGLSGAPCPWLSGFYLWGIGRACPSPASLFLLQKKKPSVETEDGEDLLEENAGEEEEAGEQAGEEREEDVST